MEDIIHLWDGEKWNGPITDGHIHLDRKGRCLDAAIDFESSGGTRLILVHKPNFSKLPEDIDDVSTAYSETLSIANEVIASTNIQVQVILGPHPVVWSHQIELLGEKRATELHIQSVDLALRFFETGDCVGIGEIGRPHFPVSPEVWKSANSMLQDILKRCSKKNAPVQFHVEDKGSLTFQELSQICSKANYPKSIALRHFAPADVSPSFTSKLPVTVSMGRGSVQKIASTIDVNLLFKGTHPPVLMETDYLDDPKRPGAVLGPRTIAKRTNELGKLLQIPKDEGGQGWKQEEISEFLWKIHRVWPDMLYGECG
ncbi:MAG: hypothetical protein CMA29_06055 [Euryarchaeota archaeon]|nr:hypothetical protein [Euryarchaeota archaeon]|tara:strand:- start:1009 stop:1950 length:942 start_codon:yes stop_codon:yes gene_type:complete